MDKKSSSEEEQEAVKSFQFLTKNVLSNPFDPQLLGSTVRFSSEERLKSQRLIDQLFSEGKAIHQGGFTLVYFITPLPTFYPVQVGFSVSKRQFKNATDRNLLKRRMREAYRLQKADLYVKLAEAKLQVALFWIYKTNQAKDFETTQTAMSKLIGMLVSTVVKKEN